MDSISEKGDKKVPEKGRKKGHQTIRRAQKERRKPCHVRNVPGDDDLKGDGISAGKGCDEGSSSGLKLDSYRGKKGSRKRQPDCSGVIPDRPGKKKKEKKRYVMEKRGSAIKCREINLCCLRGLAMTGGTRRQNPP